MKVEPGEITATISNIQRFSLHDGPGIRTTIFFKGCPLHCAWCQNPESIRVGPELSYDSNRCLDGCAKCAAVCSAGAIRAERAGRIDWALCTDCGNCETECPSGALRMIGQRFLPEDLAAMVLEDTPYFDATGGGVTLSGGEPLLQSKFLERFLPLLKARNIRVLVQTAGGVPLEAATRLLPDIDEIFFDFKLGSEAEYLLHTGGKMQRVEANLAALEKAGKRVTLRIPIVPGINSSTASIDSIRNRLVRLGVSRVRLVRYHDLWESKLATLNTRQQPMPKAPPADHEAIASRLLAAGIDVEVD